MAEVSTEVEMKDELEEKEAVDKEDEETKDSEDSSDDDDDNSEQIQLLNEQIASNPYMYDTHIQLIQLLRSSGELDQLRKAREHMSSLFPLTGTLWIEWIEDERKVMDDGDGRKNIIDLFERAVKDYTSPKVWLEYIQFSIGGMAAEGGIDAVRDVCERAITAAGLNVVEGAILWEAYREFENAILMGLQPAPGSMTTPAQQEEMNAQTKRITTIFRRQLSIPHNGMEGTWAEFNEFASEDDVKTVRPLYEKGLAKLEKLKPLEIALVHEKGDKLVKFEDYIDYEIEAGEPARIQSIFERAIHDHCLIPRLWIRYTQYLSIELKIRSIVFSAYERAVRNCPWSQELWCGYGRELEKHLEPHDQIKDLYTKALSAGFTSGYEYLTVWTAYIDYLRRRIDWSKESPEKESALWETFELARQHLTDNFAAEGDPECYLLQYEARLRAKHIRDMEKCRDLWNQVMHAGHGNKAAMWLEYYNIERSYGDLKHARKILQRALNSVSDWPESICQAYLKFEREDGETVETYQSAVSRCEAQMIRVDERRAKLAEKEAAAEAQKKQARKEKKVSKKPTPKEGHIKQEKQSPKQSQGQKQMDDERVNVEKFKGQVFVRGQSQPMQGVEIPQEIRPYKRKAPSGEMEEEVASTAETEDGFKVPGAPASTKSKAPPPGFQEPPPKSKSKAPPPGYKPKSSPPPGFQPPTSGSGEPPEKKMKTEESSEESNKEHVADPSKESRTAFVSNVDFSKTEDDLRTFFADVGEITDLRLIKSHSGRSKGFAYVEFLDELQVAKALEKDRTPLDGRPLFISKCNERTNNAASFRYSTNLEKTKLFVRGLPFSCTKEDIGKTFGEVGKLKDVRLVTYRSGAPKGIAYVEYEKESDAGQAVMKLDGLEMGEHTISVAISNPPPRKAPASQAQSFQPSLGGGKKDFGTRGKAHTQLSLMPRSVQKKPLATPGQQKQGTSGGAANSSKPEGISSATDSEKSAGKMSNADFRKMLLNS